MNKKEVMNVRAAMHQLFILAEATNRDTRSYRVKYEGILRRLDVMEVSGRGKKARLWREQLDAVKPHSKR